MNWQVYIAGPARKAVKRLPKKVVEHIEAAIFEIKTNPFLGNAIKLSGQENIWRKRIGGYRIIYQINQSQRIVRILAIKRRTSTTYS